MKEAGVCLVILYVVFSIILTAGGALEADTYSCKHGLDRPLKYVFPTYQLGCWLNTPWGK